MFTGTHEFSRVIPSYRLWASKETLLPAASKQCTDLEYLLSGLLWTKHHFLLLAGSVQSTGSCGQNITSCCEKAVHREYLLSLLLWTKHHFLLQAGRVQSTYYHGSCGLNITSCCKKAMYRVPTIRALVDEKITSCCKQAVYRVPTISRLLSINPQLMPSSFSPAMSYVSRPSCCPKCWGTCV